MNKKVFYDKLKNREYTDCIDILRNELIDILSLKIKEKDISFKYSTTKDLYNASKKYLDDKEIEIAYKLYNFDTIDEVEEYILDELFQSYKELTKDI